MDLQPMLATWGNVLRGRTPFLSLEITRECPLQCPGCYAYGGDHLGGAITLREVRDLKGQDLVDGVLALVDRHRPIHLSIVGGEPLVRLRELKTLLPLLSQRGIHMQIVTSAVRDMPLEWRDLPRFQLTVSIDGLQPEHDAHHEHDAVEVDEDLGQRTEQHRERITVLAVRLAKRTASSTGKRSSAKPLATNSGAGGTPSSM